MPLIILMLIVGAAMFWLGMWLVINVLFWGIVVIASIAGLVVGGLFFYDALRLLRFRLNARQGSGFDGQLLTPMDVRQAFRLGAQRHKRTAEETAELWSYVYRPGLSLEKLSALWLLWQEGSFFLPDWVWRVWWRASVRFASIAPGQTKVEARQLAIEQGTKSIERLTRSDLDTLIGLSFPSPLSEVERGGAEGDGVRLRLSWAQHAIGSLWKRGQALSLLRALSEEKTIHGGAALYDLLVFYVNRDDRERAFDYFAKYKKHPNAMRISDAERHLLPLFTPTIAGLNSVWGLSWMHFTNTQSATWKLSPLKTDEIEPRHWLNAPGYALSNAKPAPHIAEGTFKLRKIPFTHAHVGFVRMPPRHGATLFLTEATPVHFPRWAECFPTPRVSARHEDREQNYHIDAVLSLTESSAMVWVVDKEKRSPIANQEVLFYLKNASENITERKMLTDINGVASLSDISYWQLGVKIPHPSPSAAEGEGPGVRLGEAGPGVRSECLYLTHSSEISTGVHTKESLRLYALFPRPLYKPGELLKGVIIARTKTGDKPSRVTAPTELILVKSGKGSILTQLKSSFNSLGVFDFTIQLPKEIALGKYVFALANPRDGIEIEGSFYLEEFVAPEFRASLTAKPSEWKQPLFLSFEASYFFGGPVANASGTLEIQRRDWRYQSSGAWPPMKSYEGSKKLAPIPFTTDKNGKVEIKIPWDGPWWFSRMDGSTFTCKARLRDASGKTCEVELGVLRCRLGAIMKATPVSSMCLPGEEIDLTLHRHRESESSSWPTRLTVSFGGWFGERRLVEINPEQEHITVKAPSTEKHYRVRTSAAHRALHSAEDLYVLGASLSTKHAALLASVPSLVEGASVQVAMLGPKDATCDAVLLQYSSGARLSSRVLPWKGGAVWTTLHTARGDAPSLHVMFWYVNKKGELSSSSSVSLPVEPDAELKSASMPMSVTFEPILRHSGASLSENPESLRESDPEGFHIAANASSGMTEGRLRQEHFSPGAEAEVYVQVSVDGRASVFCSVVDASLFSLVAAPMSPLDFFERPAKKPETKAAWSATWSTAQRGRQSAPPRAHMVGFSMEEGGMMPMAAPAPMMAGAPPSQARFEMMAAPMAAMMPARKSGGLSLPSLDISFSRAKNAPGAPPPAPKVMAAAPLPEPMEVRSDFSSEVAWHTNVTLSPEGEARLLLKFSDSLTTWRAFVVAVAPDQLGVAEATTKTQKPLMIRLQAPRFLQERDTFSMQALIDSRSEEEQSIAAEIETEGLAVESSLHLKQSVAGGAQAKLAGQVTVLASDKKELVLRAKVFNQADPNVYDAEERRLPYRQFGSPIHEFYRGVLTDKEPVLFSIPKERRPEYTTLSLALDRGPLDAVIRSLSFLLEYPYGCVEQTCSRFIPHIVWERILSKRVKRNSAEDPYRGGEVISSKLVDECLARLSSMQNPDGGYGWWSRGAGNLWMTAYVAFCFSLAKRELPPKIISFLQQNLLRVDNPDDTDAFAVFALASNGVKIEERAFTILLERWENLAVSERAKLCWAMLAQEHKEARPRLQSIVDELLPKAKKLIRKVEKDTFWFRPLATEALAFVVMAMVKANDASMKEAMRVFLSLLLLHRKANQWHSTRDTALAVLALLMYEESLGEGARHATLQVVLNQQEKASLSLEGLSKDPPKITMYDADLKDGENELRLISNELDASSLAQPKHYSMMLSYFSTESDIAESSQGLEVRRVYWLLDEKQRDVRKLSTGGVVHVGQRLRVELTVRASKPLSFLLVEDPKLAGCEPLAKKSGPEVCKGSCAHVELRADRTAIFFDALNLDERTVSYEIEAQIPGVFNAMPARIETMYDDQFFGSTESFTLRIE